MQIAGIESAILTDQDLMMPLMETARFKRGVRLLSYSTRKGILPSAISPSILGDT